MSSPQSGLDPATPIILRIDSATVARPSGEVVFENLSWTVREGEAWAIVGPVGSGKTALTDLLLGRLRLISGSVDWPLVDRLRASGRSIGWPSEIAARVAFKEESRLFSYGKHYYQQRFNFIEPQDDLTLDEFLHAEMRRSEFELAEITGRLGLSELRALSFIKLSNGQTRRARIARALLARPEVLILDEPFVGLDADGRREVDAILRELVRGGLRLIFIAPAASIPDWITHVIELHNRRALSCGLRFGFKPAVPAKHEDFVGKSPVGTEPIVEMRNVNVSYGGKPILRDVSWTVRAGERWAVLGPNGAGKTTLLSLICGDHPQAYANDISIFGRRRGSGESIWELKRRIGLVSPEIHLYFTEPLTAERAAATGFVDTLVSRPTTAEQDAAVRSLFEYFGIGEFASRPFGRLSAGQQRLVLLIRALVKDAPLLILDEPFQMLDDGAIELAQRWIDERVAPARTVLFVTHNQVELPRTVTLRLALDCGNVVEIA